VEIGLFFAKRDLSDGIQVGCQPLLFRFQIAIEKTKSKEKLDTKRALSNDSRQRICKEGYGKTKALEQK
jgi:hypothetical protein